jgi:hypothetical protein
MIKFLIEWYSVPMFLIAWCGLGIAWLYIKFALFGGEAPVVRSRVIEESDD